ncbi:hypothetical protein ACEWY4_008536, partial [Coilia grayii]
WPTLSPSQNSPQRRKRRRQSNSMCFTSTASPQMWCLTEVPSSHQPSGGNSAGFWGPRSVSRLAFILKPMDNRSGPIRSWRRCCVAWHPGTPSRGPDDWCGSSTLTTHSPALLPVCLPSNAYPDTSHRFFQARRERHPAPRLLPMLAAAEGPGREHGLHFGELLWPILQEPIITGPPLLLIGWGSESGFLPRTFPSEWSLGSWLLATWVHPSTRSDAFFGPDGGAGVSTTSLIGRGTVPSRGRGCRPARFWTAPSTASILTSQPSVGAVPGAHPSLVEHLDLQHLLRPPEVFGRLWRTMPSCRSGPRSS